MPPGLGRVKVFIESQFSYCPLVWMFHGRLINARINWLHEWSLRLVYDDLTSSFDELLTKDRTCTIHHRNIQTLALEIFKTKNNLNPEFMNSIFVAKHDSGYILRNTTEFESHNIRTVHWGEDTLRYLGRKIWNIVPVNIKQSISAKQFRDKIRKWIPNDCPCRICKTYIHQLGYIDR